MGAKYPDAWHYEHMRDPRSTSPGSIMPSYGWLYEQSYTVSDIQASLGALQMVGVPYTDAEIEGAGASIQAQADGIVQRLATAKIQAEPDKEIIAMIAYLQRMGVDGRASLKAQGVQ